MFCKGRREILRFAQNDGLYGWPGVDFAQNDGLYGWPGVDFAQNDGLYRWPAWTSLRMTPTGAVQWSFFCSSFTVSRMTWPTTARLRGLTLSMVSSVVCQ